MKTILGILIINLFIANGMNAQTELTAYIEKKIVGKESPGFQYIIADSTGVLYEYNGGLANIAANIPVTPESEFKMFSSTKTLTALAIIQLIEEGKLCLDDEVGEVLNVPFSQLFTVRQVLSHTAGLTSAPLITEIHLASDHNNFDVKTNAQALIEKYQKLSYKPGKKKKYSNFGFLLLGEIIEQISGISYTEYIEENIFKLLGDDYSYGYEYNDQTTKAYQRTSSLMHYLYGMIGDLKSYYDQKEKGYMGYQDLYLNAYSYGGAFSNARSLVNYAQTLMKSDSPLISEESKKILFSEQFLNNGKSAKQSLGWFLKEYKGAKYYSHPGGGGGYSCEVRIYPELGIVSVYMMNTTQLFSHLKLLNKLDAYFLADQK